MNPPIVNVVSVAPCGEYRLRITFDDGATREVDFKPFLSGAHHPSIRAFLDPECFKAWRIEYGDLVWGDYEMCFPVMDLHSGRIDHRQPLDAAA